MNVTATVIADYLDRLLRVSRFEDSSNNGLQVANSGRVRKVCCGVDASLHFFREAARRGADFVVCHHGISWRDSLKRLTGQNYQRVSFLMRNDMALYACHLPLDAHPQHGNNALICRALGLRKIRPFGLYHGSVIGFAGDLPRALPYESFKRLVRERIGSDLRTMDFGAKLVRRVAVVSGGGCDNLPEAVQEGYDVFLSGEAALHAYHTAEEGGIHAVFAGHYATERFGVQALAEVIHRRFRIPAEFVDLEIEF